MLLTVFTVSLEHFKTLKLFINDLSIQYVIFKLLMENYAQKIYRLQRDHKKEEEEIDLINRVIETLKNGVFVKYAEWSDKDFDFLNN